jgi:heme peroxidase
MTGLFHGTWWDQHQDPNLDNLMQGRFTRLLPANQDEVNGTDLERLAERMTAHQEERPTPETEHDPEEDSEITAAYTYLGQFTDHDLTFDPTSQLREFLKTAEQLDGLKDYRTPRFDLDNLYGRGPADQPYLYDADGIRMLLGEPMTGNPFDPRARQIPRGPNGRALIGDPRNDENRIVAQLHAVFLRFHNKVADHLGKTASFDEVRQQVRWHYQWMLVTDFLPAVVNETTYRSIFADLHHPAPRLPGIEHGLQFMPVEFSVAAFRFGHSMARPEYRLNTTIDRRPIFTRDRRGRAPTDDAADLGGFRPIPSDWAIDWQFFIDLEPGKKAQAISPLYDPLTRKPQHAYKIDTSLVSPLRYLPSRITSPPSILALRNLERGRVFLLPSGQEVARALGEDPIPGDKLMIGKATEGAEQKPLADFVPGLADRAPLWAYILSEAQVTSWKDRGSAASKDVIPVKLGPVGGRIVAGVFAALLQGDPTSYLNQGSAFKPIEKFTRRGEFGLAQLINVALGRTP